MRIAITGASGFIGRALCATLSAAGHDLRPLPRLRGAEMPSFENVDAVVHLAAIAHRRGAARAELERVNVSITEALGRAAARAGARLVFLSSVKVHGEHSHTPLHEGAPIAPQDAYADSKARAEDALRSIEGLRLVVLRPPLVYGPAVKANFLKLMQAVARGLPLPLARMENRRSLVYVGNVADAILHCIQHERAPDRTYLVSDGAPISTRELCVRLGAALGRPAKLFPFPALLIKLVPAARPLFQSLEVDDSAIRRELGWRPPSSLEEGLRATAHWYLAR